MLPSLLLATPFVLAIAASALPPGLALRHAAIGTALVSLAVAAASHAAAAPSSFHTINNAIMWGGLLLGVVAAAEGWWEGGRASVVSLAVALVVAVAGCGATLREGRMLLSLLAGLAGAAALTVLRVGTATPAPPEPTAVSRVGGFRRWAMPLLLSLLLIPALWLWLTVAGPEGMSLQNLREAPFSEAAETLLAALLLPASLVLAGIWPFGGVTRGPRYAPLGALLLLAVVLPLLGQGVEHWRSLYAGWIVLGAVVAAVAARWPQFMACAGLFAMVCGGSSAWWAGMSLTLIASLMSLAPGMRELPVRMVMLAAAGCGVVALRATLGSEVVYSVTMLLATIIGILRTPLPLAASR